MLFFYITLSNIARHMTASSGFTAEPIKETLCKTTSAHSICTMDAPDRQLSDDEASSYWSEVKASSAFTGDSDSEEEETFSPARITNLADNGTDDGEASRPIGPSQAARANFELLRGLAVAAEAKARFESRLELDEDDETDSEDEFVRGFGKCARQWAVGSQPRRCAQAQER